MRWIFVLWTMVIAGPLVAQSQTLEIATITRPPFSMEVDGANTGFSIDLWTEVSSRLGVETNYQRFTDFGAMLAAVEAGEVDGAVANISITSERERVMDFTQPIFRSGLQIMVPAQNDVSLFRALMRWDLALAVLAAFGVLLLIGMLMWAFERRHQEYFNRPVGQAWFPAFWWALNLIVNGGFEERQPVSAFGRLLAVVLVVSSLFVVSIFVANITAVMTVAAIQSSVSSPSDLQGRRVGVPENSTSERFARDEGLSPRTFGTITEMYAQFEAGRLDAVIYDAPLLAYYVNQDTSGNARLVDRVFKPENYGMALPSGSPLREDINRTILQLREEGIYDDLISKWFGAQ